MSTLSEAVNQSLPTENQNYNRNSVPMGSVCCSVGRGIASDTRGPWFKSSHRQFFTEHLLTFLSTVVKRRK